tara:strand:- start:420 stop:896 length:477 start_codon:yes stop_codon:yes gene_type:complete
MEKTELKDTYKICTLCGTEFKEFGNNAMPIKEGICCDWCDKNVVIPARIKEGLGYTKIKIHFDRVSEEWAEIEGLVAPNLRGYINHVNDVSDDSIDEAYALRLADHKLSCLMSEWMELRDVIKAAKAAGITASNNSVISELYFKQTIEVFQKIINLDK